MAPLSSSAGAIPAPAADRTCLVTGASSGIGRELARQLAARGHGVTLVARRRSLLEELAGQIRSAHDVRVEVVDADLTDEVARAAIVEQVAGLGLSIDVLVNNAGLSTTGPVHEADRRRELTMVRTDVEAVVDLCTLCTPGMVERRRGAVLNVASTAAFQPLPGQAGYGACKAFVLSYSHALRAELGGTGVVVTTLCPGPVETGFAEAAGFTSDEAGGSLPRIMWMDAPSVARAALQGLDAGRAVVVPGPANRLVAAAGRLAPPALVSSLVARRHPALHRSH